MKNRSYLFKTKAGRKEPRSQRTLPQIQMPNTGKRDH